MVFVAYDFFLKSFGLKELSEMSSLNPSPMVSVESPRTINAFGSISLAIVFNRKISFFLTTQNTIFFFSLERKVGKRNFGYLSGKTL